MTSLSRSFYSTFAVVSSSIIVPTMHCLFNELINYISLNSVSSNDDHHHHDDNDEIFFLHLINDDDLLATN